MVALSPTMCKSSRSEKVTSCTRAYVVDSTGLRFTVQLQKAALLHGRFTAQHLCLPPPWNVTTVEVDRRQKNSITGIKHK